MREIFRKIAKKASDTFGSAWAFVLALTIVVVWAVTGPIFNFTNTWQLFINTFTTIMTFLMVFLIQNTQNRDSKAMHLKIDELIKSSGRASNKMIDLEDLSDEDLDKMAEHFRSMDKEHIANKITKAKKK